MSIRTRLQKFDYRRSPYHRVTQDWVCGHAASGKACRIGPNGRGQCPADFECQPLKSDAGRWSCTRSDLAGGRCEQGPLPDGTCCNAIPKCQPYRSLRAKRRAISRWILVACVGLLGVVLGGPMAANVFHPGDLTFQHGRLADNCGACHTGFSDGPSGWLHAAFSESNEMADNKLCLGCHTMGETPNSPHALPEATLAALSDSARNESRGSGGAGLLTAATRAVFRPQDTPTTDLSCMTCHTEHKGQDANISVLSNGQCQACHASAFDRFAGDHPDFGDYPYTRRTRIAFDHVSHIGKHFREDDMAEAAPKECADCHAPAPDGVFMTAFGFEETCAACHGAQIEGAGRATAKGIAVFTVPGLDVATLAERGAGLGHWPDFADAPPTPFMDLLLASDLDYADARRALEAVSDPLDLTAADDATIAAAERLGWAVKGLYFDLLVDGTSALAERIEGALRRPLQTAEVAELTALLPADTVRTGITAWFPNLIEEVQKHRLGVAVPMKGAAVPETVEAADAPAMDEEGDGDILGDLEAAADDTEDGGILGDLGDAAEDEDGGILGDLGDAAEDEDGGILGDLEDAAEDEGGGILGDLGDDAGDEGGNILDGLSESNDDVPAAVTESALAEPVEPVQGEDWAAVGGWYVDYFTLRYRPTGHADSFLRSWLTYSGDAMGAGASGAEAVFASLSEPKAPGLCAKCHALDAAPEGGVSVAWRGRQPAPDVEPFTHFSHQSHFSLLDQKGCLACHTLDPEAKFLTGFTDTDPMTFSSNFKPLQRSVCAECHVAAGAGDGCTMCHNYHVGTFPPAVASTPEMMESMSHDKQTDIQ